MKVREEPPVASDEEEEPIKNKSFKNEENGGDGDVVKSLEVTGLPSDEEGETDAVWDLIRVIPATDPKIECRYESCTERAIATWASDKDPQDEWPLCEKCQLEDFGGWPEDVEPIEQDVDTVSVSARSTAEDKVRSTTGNGNDGKIETPQPPPIPASTIETPRTSKDDVVTAIQGTSELDTAQDEDDPQPSEEKYELSEIVSLKMLLGSPIKCSDEDCNLPACSVWTSTNDKKKWYYCIDCQERDFGGWPTSKELPCDYIQPEHLRTMASMCSAKKKPKIPKLTSHCVTPPPNRLVPKKVTTAASRVLSGEAKVPVPKVSRSAVARHEKWQADAKKMGVNRIIVKKNEAIKVVFDALYDAFRPMNLDNIYMMLKKMIPHPVLKAALGEMSMDWRDDETFGASDDEDHDAEGLMKKKRPDAKDPYSGSLIFKAGKSVASSLYYVDHTKIKEMDIEESRELAEKLANTLAEHEQLTLTLKQKDTKTTKLLIEPTNDELVELLSDSEKNASLLVEKVDSARELTVNEPHKKKLKRRIQSMAGHYRKRKQLCSSFLSSLEEMSDGAISKTKCLKGDGQIALDSDESINKAAIAYAKSKRVSNRNTGVLADKHFVGIALDSQKMVKRVYIDEE